ncbi:hypothetical protein BDU57DRAFT_540703 [Ampelomyces quisqualis]|uniref:Uncharacterized protein n=1 Tax=Ampelomyces quisqualis TaxID=50730 RepID=A0A6A5QL90_AMPQU|nr:hypothetical protein BDU57DRAFT_540703 [Ampelomyces quisqualis]
MTRTIRSIASKACQKAASHTSSLLYSAFGIPVHDEGHVPLLVSQSSTESSPNSNKEDSLSSEDIAHILRAKQDKLYEEECQQRYKDISSLRLMHNGGHHIVRIHAPATNILKPQSATFHHVSDTSTAMHEQRNGFVASMLDNGAATQEEKRERGQVSVPAYLQRRGAIKRKMGLPLPEASHGEFDWAWYECDVVGKNGARYCLEHLLVHSSAW